MIESSWLQPHSNEAETGNGRSDIKTRVIVNSTWRPVSEEGSVFLSWILNSSLNQTSKGNELKINLTLKAAK